MPQIIVCSLAKISETGRIYRPAAMITVLDNTAPVPRPESLAAEGYLRLNFSDLAMLLPNRRKSQTEQLEYLLAFGRKWHNGAFGSADTGNAADNGSKSDRGDGGDAGSKAANIAPLLIHCQFGISRSPAAAFILACALRPDKSEQFWAEELHRQSPSAAPNPSLVALADAIMQRGSRMSAAIAAMPAPSASASAAPFTLEV